MMLNRHLSMTLFARYGCLETTKQFPLQRIELLGFPEGTWKTLRSKGLLLIKSPKSGKGYYFYNIPLKAQHLSLFYSIPEKAMATLFKGVVQPIYLVLLVMFLSFLAMTMFYFSKEEREVQLESAYQQIQDEHSKHLTLTSRYQRVIETSNDGFVVVHPEEKRILDVNNAFCEMLGYRMDELIGKTPFDLVDEENMKILKEQATTPNDQYRDFEIEFLRKDGNKRLVHISSSFVPATKEEDEGFRFALITDITEQKRHKEAIARRDAILEAVSKASSLVITHETAQEVADRLLQLLGEASGIQRISVVRIRPEKAKVSFTVTASWHAEKGNLQVA